MTIELSIYQSIIFNADLYSGMALGIIQLILTLFLSSLILFNQNYDQSFLINKSSITNFQNNLISVLFYLVVFYFIPFLILIKGLSNFNAQLILSTGFLNSISNSMLISILSVLLSVFISLSALFVYRSFLEKIVNFINQFLSL